ncbi:metal-dependent phosphohydrolase [Oscillatoria sp. FACHB-1407]|uniref:Npun_R2479 family HD domain-containing metalloprotein n=1 Tax=Oscillatoria sp. FACHB-1407 TaxID=2692847 RepID=UPI0016886880|nr:Npun_R2479 family HD domain-containing metalloprotein [Oscillatoria sp. FACHB-1407]MBD2461196.1 metal-dependent phosphohydrolase [Oscillatoria sp. FACHB-1407]
MFNPTEVMIDQCVKRLTSGYHQAFGNRDTEYADLIGWVAHLTLEAIAHSDAPYHDIEHTILVTLVGQDILRGKQCLDGYVSPKDWAHYIISLLCHDIGYVKGVCQPDQMTQRLFASGRGDNLVQLAAGATDASLTPYHVDRGQQFVAEKFSNHPLIEVALIQDNIELTRFPAPDRDLYRDTYHYPGLTRAADLIGQLSDPRYLQKLPTLFYEFAETGTNQQLGYHHPDDLRASYPNFYRKVVYPYVQTALTYLEATQQGRQIVANLYANVLSAEQNYAGLSLAA